MSSDIFAAMKIHVVVFSFMKPRSLIGDYPEDKCSAFLQIVGKYIPHYAASYSGRQYGHLSLLKLTDVKLKCCSYTHQLCSIQRLSRQLLSL
jgi:hypothetical protein